MHVEPVTSVAGHVRATVCDSLGQPTACVTPATLAELHGLAYSREALHGLSWAQGVSAAADLLEEGVEEGVDRD